MKHIFQKVASFFTGDTFKISMIFWPFLLLPLMVTCATDDAPIRNIQNKSHDSNGGAIIFMSPPLAPGMK